MDEREKRETRSAVSRRAFLKGLGSAAVATGAVAPAAADDAGGDSAGTSAGPGAVRIFLKINGERHVLEVEPRVTLLDALRYSAGKTGTKEVCDRGSCGACTVLLDGSPVYSCMTLAIEAQGKEITTVEGIAKKGELTPLQQAFVDCDATMCGFCTPGFVVSLSAFLEENPKPTREEVRHACSGNLCRCGTYPQIEEAVLVAAGVETASEPEVVELKDEDLA